MEKFSKLSLFLFVGAVAVGCAANGEFDANGNPIGGKADTIDPVGEDNPGTITATVLDGSAAIDPRFELFVDDVKLPWGQAVPQQTGTHRYELRYDGKRYQGGQARVLAGMPTVLAFAGVMLKTPGEYVMVIDLYKEYDFSTDDVEFPSNVVIPTTEGTEFKGWAGQGASDEYVKAKAVANQLVTMDFGDYDIMSQLEFVPPLARTLPDASCEGRTSFTPEVGDIVETARLDQPFTSQSRAFGMEVRVRLPCFRETDYKRFYAPKGLTSRIELGRIDVNHVLVNGVRRPGNYRISGYGEHPTGTGVDVFPGTYTVRITYNTVESGLKTITQTMTVGKITESD